MKRMDCEGRRRGVSEGKTETQFDNNCGWSVQTEGKDVCSDKYSLWERDIRFERTEIENSAMPTWSSFVYSCHQYHILQLIYQLL